MVLKGQNVPMTEPEINTRLSRKNALKLLVLIDNDKHASGQLFWDDGDSIDIIENDHCNYYEFQMHSNGSLGINIV
jgi:hypothetical protein